MTADILSSLNTEAEYELRARLLSAVGYQLLYQLAG